MPSSYSTRVRVELQADGENNNTWGARCVANTFNMFDECFGVEAVTCNSSVTLSANNGATDQSRNMVLKVTGTGGTVTVGNVEKAWLVENGASSTLTFTTGSGTTATVPATQKQWVYSAGGNTVYATTWASLAGTETLTNKTLTAPVIATIVNTGTLTLPTSNDTLVGKATTDTLTNKSINWANNTITMTTAQANTALSDNDFATLAGSETLTTKTINLSSNTLTGTKAQFDTACSDGDFAYVGAANTFTAAQTATAFIPSSSTVPTNGSYLPAANTLGWAINSAAEMQLTSTALSPAADGGSSLGTTALGWQNIFGNTGFVFNIENGDWVATHTAGILTVGTGDLRVTTAGTNAASAVTVGGTQTLTNKTLTTPAITTPTMTGTMIEDIYTITDGAAFEIDPANGSIQNIVLGANRTPKATNFNNGQAILLAVDDGTARTLTWTDATFGGSGVVWMDGATPVLATSGYTWLGLWKMGNQVYGNWIGAG